jgi:hypothetical protein
MTLARIPKWMQSRNPRSQRRDLSPRHFSECHEDTCYNLRSNVTITRAVRSASTAKLRCCISHGAADAFKCANLDIVWLAASGDGDLTVLLTRFMLDRCRRSRAGAGAWDPRTQVRDLGIRLLLPRLLLGLLGDVPVESQVSRARPGAPGRRVGTNLT